MTEVIETRIAFRINKDVWLGTSVEENSGTNPTYTFQISVDDLVAMQVLETAGDPNRLRTGEWTIKSPVS